MDKIYSRKRIPIPKVKGFYLKKDKKSKNIIIILIMFSIAILTFWTISKSISPIFYGLCIEKVKNIGTEIVNEESNNVLNNTNYKELISVIYDEKNNTNILKTDVVKINKIASDIALGTEEKFNKIDDEKIKIPLGALIGNKYFAGMGPEFNINVIPTGNIITELKTEFEAQGINQTMYRIYLELKCEVSILTPYKNINEQIINQVLLVETLVVGNVPQTYYRIDGISTENALNLIE